ncbi:unnamed protein product [Chrysodeixis includens]|uniref:Beta-hexosaminidase n=1 Tax=Chrysodeixis includens TaxID=689277 RepID=A0A9P0BR68_CHRIL|nr:unnamed protein product [Chrysodeixis includens]
MAYNLPAMLRHVIIVNALCVLFVTSFTIIKPGPQYPPTKGEVWPKPHQQTKEDAYYKYSTSLSIKETGKTCDILKAAIERYSSSLRSTQLIASKYTNSVSNEAQNASEDANYKGELQQLQINLRSPCERYPYLDMDEKYSLNISSTSTLDSDSIWGVLRGLETFVQQFYVSDDYSALLINASQIVDFPKYSHRGLLIDTSRHYLSLSTILKTLDAMEMNKMNVLHWHIVDDQSFPYQSEKFPDLSKAAYHPKFIYTADNIKEILNYATFRGIRVMPEFDVPGHTSSWGIAFPNILTQCYRGDKVEGLGPMDPTKNATYEVIRDLFQEVQERFPDKYLHVGGDEVEMSCWSSNPEISKFMEDHEMRQTSELHSYFMSRVIPLLGERSKPIVWQEVFDENVVLPNGTIVQVWKNVEAYEMLNILNAGHKVIYSASWYLDHVNGGGDWSKYYSSDPREKVSAYYPDVNVDNIVGGEACMWGEVVNDSNMISRVWPRASAVAEVLWSGLESNIRYSYYTRQSVDVYYRLEEHVCRMNQRGVKAQPANGPGFCITDTE